MLIKYYDPGTLDHIGYVDTGEIKQVNLMPAITNVNEWLINGDNIMGGGVWTLSDQSFPHRKALIEMDRIAKMINMEVSSARMLADFMNSQDMKVDDD